MKRDFNNIPSHPESLVKMSGLSGSWENVKAFEFDQ